VGIADAHLGVGARAQPEAQAKGQCHRAHSEQASSFHGLTF
jgi:hypothetical protein